MQPRLLLPLAVILSLGAQACAAPADQDPPEQPTSTATSTPSPRIPVPKGAPRRLVAATDDGTIVILSADGSLRRRLTGPEQLDFLAHGLVGLSLAPHGQWLSVGYRSDACSARLVRVSMVDGEVTALGPGGGPAISPNGKKLAYFTGAGVYACDPSPAVVVRDLKTGAERTWKTRSGPAVTPVRLTWASDSRHLLVEDVWEDASTLRLLDTERHRSYGSSPLLGPRQQARSWTLPAYRGRLGTLAVVEVSGYPDPAPRRILSVDPESGRVRRMLLRVAPTWLEFDTSGHHLLFVMFPSDSGELFRWSGGEPVSIARGVLAADW